MATAKKQVMDVARPGQTTASPTARPLIIGHGAIIKDPTIQQAPSEEPTPEPVKSSQAVQPPSIGEKVIAPLSPKPDVTPEKPEPPSEPAAASAAPEPAKEIEPEEGDGIDTASDAVVDAVLEQTAKKKDKEKSAEAEQRQELVQQLVEDKTYFLPIRQKGGAKRTGVALVWILVLAAAAGAGFYAYKTGLLKLPF